MSKYGQLSETDELIKSLRGKKEDKEKKETKPYQKRMGLIKK